MTPVARSVARPVVHPVTPVKALPPDLPPGPVTFNFAIPSINIAKTRSRDNDTDFATLGIVVYAADGTQLNTYGPSTLKLGDLGNGAHGLYMLSTGIEVPDGAKMGVSFTIANNGSSSAVDTFVNALNEVAAGVLGALASGQIAGYATDAKPGTPATPTTPAQDPTPAQAKAIDTWVALLAEIGTLAVVGLVNYFLADCDGMVVTDLLTYGRPELDQAAAQDWWSLDRNYPGSDSPVGCRGNSNYTVTYEVLASPPGVTVPNLFGADPAKVAGILAPVGLVGRETGSAKGNVDAPEVEGQIRPPAG